MAKDNTKHAYEYIRKRILSGRFAPGAALDTTILAEETGVSRTPVRDALRQLQADGLVTIEHRLGARVKSMTLREFQDMLGIRLALETYAANQAALNWSKMDLFKIKKHLEAMDRLVDEMAKDGGSKGAVNKMALEDMHFHMAIVDAASNVLLKEEIIRLRVISRVVSCDEQPSDYWNNKSHAERKSLRSEIQRCHHRIFSAIEKRDAEGAKKAMEDHVQDILDRSLEVFAIATHSMSEEVEAYL